MEKFKLIQAYPGGPEVNTIVTPSAHDKDIFRDEGSFRLHRTVLEAFPEFWETSEIILGGELRIRTNRGTKVLQANSVNHLPNGFALMFTGFNMAFELGEGETDFNFCE